MSRDVPLLGGVDVWDKDGDPRFTATLDGEDGAKAVGDALDEGELGAGVDHGLIAIQGTAINVDDDVSEQSLLFLGDLLGFLA